MRNSVFHEDCAKDCQEIEELRRICCEETDRARQLKLDELSMQQERNTTTVSQLLDSNSGFTIQGEFLADAREFYDPETASTSGASHVPSQPMSIPSPRETCVAAILDCRLIQKMVRVLRETFFEDHLLKKEYPQQSSTIKRIWHLPLRD